MYVLQIKDNEKNMVFPGSLFLYNILDGAICGL